MRQQTGSLLAFIGLVAAGCAPAASEESLESSIVVTLHAPNADFGGYQTFFLRPEIRELTLDGTASATIDPAVAEPLLEQTRRQMESRGYRSVADKAIADLAVEMIYTESDWVSTYCYSWWDPYYWGYPSYYYYPYYGCSGTTWQTNTVATMLTDLTPARDQGRGDPVGDGGTAPPKSLNGLWFSGINGIVFSTGDSMQKALDGINQAFQQSPYLSSRQ
jgi:hypothetical protein